MRPTVWRRSLPGVLLTAVLVVITVGYAAAQRRSFGGGGGRYAPPVFPDGDFVICRLAYPEGPRFAGGYLTDHPLGEQNLSIRFSELTRTRVSRGPDRTINHYLVRLSDDQLFNCPFLMAGDVGSMSLGNSADAKRLREYLLKGGFLWADDFWGSYAWDWWAAQFAKVLPPSEYPIIDLPPNHPLFSAQFVIQKVPQIASINYWASSGGDTSERGADSREAHARAILDKHGNIMVLMTHNTDLGDSFEREADDPQYFYQMSVPGYAFGVNALLYALTH